MVVLYITDEDNEFYIAAEKSLRIKPFFVSFTELHDYMVALLRSKTKTTKQVTITELEVEG